MEEDRRYSDREVEALIARAVELAREDALPAKAGRGMSLAELEKAAAEAGLPVESIRRAARELEGRGGAGASSLRRFFGAQKEAAERRLLSEPRAEDISRLLLVLPDLANAPGSSMAAPGGFIYRTDGGYEARMGSRLRLELAKEGEASVLRVERTYDGAAGGIYGGLVGGLGIGMGMGVGFGVGLGALHSPLFAILFLLASLGLSFLAARSLMGLFRKEAKKKNERLLEEAAARLEKR
jgi:hypothetical protein